MSIFHCNKYLLVSVTPPSHYTKLSSSHSCHCNGTISWCWSRNWSTETPSPSVTYFYGLTNRADRDILQLEKFPSSGVTEAPQRRKWVHTAENMCMTQTLCAWFDCDLCKPLPPPPQPCILQDFIVHRSWIVSTSISRCEKILTIHFGAAPPDISRSKQATHHYNICKKHSF